MATAAEDRYTAIHLLRAGHKVEEVAQQLGRTSRWVRKWRKRYETQGWSGLEEQSRAPQQVGNRTSVPICQAIIQARSELEASAALGQGLKYIGATAIRTKLKTQQLEPLPSLATIERVVKKAGLSRRRQAPSQTPEQYPHLQPSQAHQLCQVDIVPHYLRGGQAIACFNALDVVSRYPTGQAFERRRSQEAAAFLLHVWQTMGLPRYTQVDNEGCFSGGFTHPYVLGRVVRLALTVGTQLLFSPIRHPESNAYVERFHQDYNDHVWTDTYLEDQPAVQNQTDHFLALYRHSQHHSALHGLSPHHCHYQSPPRCLEVTFKLSDQKLPLREGQVHFIRQVQPDGSVSVLNATWSVPNPTPRQGVWVTLNLRLDGATLSIYDAAPDVSQRVCLAAYPFPLTEPVLPPLQATAQQNTMVKAGGDLLLATLTRTARFAHRFISGTMS